MDTSNLICGIGVRDEVQDDSCPFQLRWKAMLNRCYSRNVHFKRPTYKSINVCEEWKLFSNFKKWMKSQNWQGLDLDKDILSNSSVYSPYSCCFVPSKINNSLQLKSKQNSLPYGVTMSGDKFRARHFKNGKDFSLGSFSTKIEAHKAWQWARSCQIEETVAWYATQDCFRTDVADALTQRVWQLRLDHKLGVETRYL